MDDAVKERLIGAAILVAIVVLVVPALLRGPHGQRQAQDPAAAGMRSMEIELAPVTPPEEQVVQTEDEAAPAETMPETRTEVPAVEATAPAAAQAEPAPTPPAAAGAQVDETGASAAEPGSWAVQVAALSKRDSAAALVEKLQAGGYRAFVLEYRADGRVLYRVRIGPETQRERAESLAARLASDGYPGTVVAHP